MDSLLRQGDPISVPAIQRFAVSANFAPDMSPQARIRIASARAVFVRWFFPKNEDAALPVVLEWFELQHNTSNPAILNELGGVANAETSLASAYWLMLQQSEGQSGPLATNGFGNVFYVRDLDGQLRSVNIHWCDGGWSIDAMEIDTITEWPIRDRVFRPHSGTQSHY